MDFSFSNDDFYYSQNDIAQDVSRIVKQNYEKSIFSKFNFLIFHLKIPAYSQSKTSSPQWDFQPNSNQEDTPKRWNTSILDSCHIGEKFRLVDELIFPLNKSNTKYMKIGYTPT
jgi:hypothetical protein